MQHILITGGNSGIGKKTALGLAQDGERVIIAARNMTKVNEAIQDIKVKTGNEEIYGISCDLASFESIRNAARYYREQYGQLDILINNAGLVTDKLGFTQDGLETQFGVNHIGHFLLTHELIDLLQKAPEPRIVNVSSTAHLKGKINFNSFKGELGADKYKGMAAYAQSKLANVLFTKELARRYPNITSHCLHPGVVRTSIGNKNDNRALISIAWTMMKPFMISAASGAKTSLYLARSKDVLKVNGLYYHNQKERKPSPLAHDQKLAEKLWEASEGIIGKE